MEDRRSKLATALALALGWQCTSAMADERFIVQPKYRTQVESGETKAVAETEAKAIGDSGKATPSMADSAPAEAAGLASTPPAPSQVAETVVETSELTLYSILESPPSTAKPVNARPNPPSLEPQTTSGNRLMWIARGSEEAFRNPNIVNRQATQAIEFENPNYVESVASQVPVPATPVPATPRSLPGPNQPTVAGVQPVGASDRSVLAELVSAEIMSDGGNDAGRAIQPVDAPPGWQSVGNELSQRLSRCESLLNKKAYFSAREEAETAVLYLVRVLDLMSNDYRSEPAWHASQRALLEAEDFSTAQRLTSDHGFLRRLVASHQTPVLKDADVSTLAPLAAAQHYRLYAQQKLGEAAEGHPWASEVIYALGRTFQAQAEVDERCDKESMRWRAVTLYRAACSIAPQNAVAANQLGFVLLQMDRPADAREALVASIGTRATTESLQNLIEASRRLGDTRTADWAMQHYVGMKNASTATAAPGPAYVEVDPVTFAALSPYTIGPNPGPANSAIQAPQGRTAGLPSMSGNY